MIWGFGVLGLLEVGLEKESTKVGKKAQDLIDQAKAKKIIH